MKEPSRRHSHARGCLQEAQSGHSKGSDREKRSGKCLWDWHGHKPLGESDLQGLLEPVLFALRLRFYLSGDGQVARALSGKRLNSQSAACCQPDVMTGHSGALGQKSGGRAQRWPQLAPGVWAGRPHPSPRAPSAEQRCERHKEFSHRAAGFSQTFACV